MDEHTIDENDFRKDSNYINATPEEKKLIEDLENRLLKTNTKEEQDIFNKALMLRTKNDVNGGWEFWFQSKHPDPPIFKYGFYDNQKK